MNLIKEILQTLIDVFFYLYPTKKPSEDELSSVKIIAHRGWHDNKIQIENTMESFTCAYDEGLFGIELDLRWTKDLVPIIHHDEDLNRLWGIERNIDEMTFDELKALVPQIPSLSSIIDHFGKKMVLFIELKDSGLKEIEKKKNILKKELESLEPSVDFYIITLDPVIIDLFNIYENSTYLLVAELNISLLSKKTLSKNIGGLTGHYLLMTDEMKSTHKEIHQKVGTGFIRTKNCAYREINRHIDWIFTNHPWNLKSLLKPRR